MYKNVSAYPLVKKEERATAALTVLWIYWRRSHHSVRSSRCFWPCNLLPAHGSPLQTPHTRERMICIRAPCEVSLVISAVSVSFIVKGDRFFLCSRPAFVFVSTCVQTVCAHRWELVSWATVQRGPVPQDLSWSGLEAYLAGLSSLDSLRGGWVCLRKPREVLHCLKTQL